MRCQVPRSTLAACTRTRISSSAITGLAISAVRSTSSGAVPYLSWTIAFIVSADPGYRMAGSAVWLVIGSPLSGVACDEAGKQPADQAYNVCLRCKLDVHCKYVKLFLRHAADAAQTGGPSARDARCRAGAPYPVEPGTGAARRGRLRRRERNRDALDAQARPGSGGRGDVAVQPRRQQGGHARRHDRPGFQRDRAAVRRGRLEEGHAAAGDLGPDGPIATSLGDRPDGVTDVAGPGDDAAPRRRPRVPSGGRLLTRAGRARLLGPRQLHLRVRTAGAGAAVRHSAGDRGAGAGHAGTLPR